MQPSALAGAHAHLKAARDLGINAYRARLFSSNEIRAHVVSFGVYTSYCVSNVDGLQPALTCRPGWWTQWSLMAESSIPLA
jgi:hypothetical protein